MLTALTWLVLHETAAVSAQVLCTPCNHATCHFMQSHIRKVYACLAVTCHLHFLQNDRDLLRATAVTRGWNGYRNKSQHRKSTLEKKILPPLQKALYVCLKVMRSLNFRGENLKKPWNCMKTFPWRCMKMCLVLGLLYPAPPPLLPTPLLPYPATSPPLPPPHRHPSTRLIVFWDQRISFCLS